MVPTSTLNQLPQWALSTEGAVLALLASDEDLTQAEMGRRLGLTERSAYRAVEELIKRGCVQKSRDGRRCRYVVVEAIGKEPAPTPSLWQRLRSGR